jgi:hypothetical protein
MKYLLTLLLLTIMIAAVPAAAQIEHIGVYFTYNGEDYSRYAHFNDFIISGYVIAYVEDVVRGASFKMTMSYDYGLTLLDEVYPANVHVGDIMSGLDIGYVNPMYGYFRNPVFLCNVIFVNDNYPGYPGAVLYIKPAFKHDTPLYADANAVVHPIAGAMSYLGSTIANEKKTWGDVKSLYR